MESVQSFLDEYFRLRTEKQKASSEAFNSVKERFFAEGYAPFKLDTVANSAAEKVLTVTAGAESTEVTTSGFTGGKWRARYRLIPSGDSWRISRIEWECGICHGSGTLSGGRECKPCKGKGWKLLGGSPV